MSAIKGISLQYRFMLLQEFVLMGLISMCLFLCRTVRTDPAAEYIDGMPPDSVNGITRPTPNDNWENETIECNDCHHIAVESYELSKHFDLSITCMVCHGNSSDHVTDQVNKPDITFKRPGEQDIEFCRIYCHTELPLDPHKDVEDCIGCHPAHTF